MQYIRGAVTPLLPQKYTVLINCIGPLALWVSKDPKGALIKTKVEYPIRVLGILPGNACENG